MTRIGLISKSKRHWVRATARGSLLAALISTGPALYAAASFGRLGAEQPPAGLLAGDQVYPSVSINLQGGWIVWQDNMTDGDGYGISGRRLANNFSGTGQVIHINQKTQGDQENASVTMLSDGSAVVIWQGGEPGGQDIYARFLRPDGLFAGNDILLNTYTYAQQRNPMAAVLTSGQIIAIWSSYGQDGSMEGIYGQRLSSSGAKVGSEFRVNETTALNQRDPSIAPLDSGGFVVAWISEQARADGNIDVFTYARTFNSAANPFGGEMRVNSSTNLSSSPSVTGISGGGFVTTWSERNLSNLQNHWQIVARAYNGSFKTPAVQVSTNPTGDRYAPHLVSGRDALMVVWTSMGQDGSREGVFGRFLSSAGEPLGAEFQVNTFSDSMQIHPAVASDGSSQYLVAWSSFVGITTGFDLLAQRYGPAPSQPVLTVGRDKQIQFRIEPGTLFQLQSSKSLQFDWADYGPLQVATGTNVSIPVSPEGSAFFRLKVDP